jgi:glyoxylase-like metal-dependent hydrolase (beta-lactamase superfamily II)
MTVIPVPRRQIVGVRAANPGPFTLSGTNTWIIGRDPAWVVDPGPALSDHVGAVLDEAGRRGGVGGVAVTHGHPDHTAAVPALLERSPGAVVAAPGPAADVQLEDSVRIGPLVALHLPGHARDHFVFIAGDVALTGDAVLGEGSVFIEPAPGALAGYLEGLQRLRRREPAILCPGHGPLVLNAQAKLDEYVAHRLERERRLIAALDAGRRSTEELLDDVWDDVPAALRSAAAMTLAAHLDKLAEEGRLPQGVERSASPS